MPKVPQGARDGSKSKSAARDDLGPRRTNHPDRAFLTFTSIMHPTVVYCSEQLASLSVNFRNFPPWQTGKWTWVASPQSCGALGRAPPFSR